MRKSIAVPIHAKLIYKYQILYLDRITIVPWRHLVNDTDLCRSLKSPKKIHKTPILAFKVIEFGADQELVYDFLLVINSNLGPISHRYWDKCTKHQFIHLLTVTCNEWHIENSKNHKKVISLTITSPNCQCAVEWYHLFMIFAVFDVSLIACRR